MLSSSRPDDDLEAHEGALGQEGHRCQRALRLPHGEGASEPVMKSKAEELMVCANTLQMFVDDIRTNIIVCEKLDGSETYLKDMHADNEGILESAQAHKDGILCHDKAASGSPLVGWQVA